MTYGSYGHGGEEGCAYATEDGKDENEVIVAFGLSVNKTEYSNEKKNSQQRFRTTEYET